MTSQINQNFGTGESYLKIKKYTLVDYNFFNMRWYGMRAKLVCYTSSFISLTVN